MVVKKASRSSTGGFGTSNVAVITKPKKEEDDYAIYPALEKSVVDTLVPTPDSSLVDENSDIMREVYDRISQVHGFPNFNFVVADDNDEETNNEDENSEDEAVSFEDLFLLSNDDDEEVKHEETEKNESTIISSPVDKLPPFNKFHVLHMDPLVLQIDDFFTHEECDKYIQEKATINQDNDDKDDSNKDKDIESISKFKTRSKTVGKDSNAKAQRTSTTWFLNYKDAPELMGKAQRLLGISSSEQGIKVFEEPQAVRYRQTEKFTWHLDALSPDALQNDPNGAGQRVATLLVYLTDLEKGEGGATMFRDLKTEDGEGPLKVYPKKGSACLFFPSAGGIPNQPFDIRTLHAGEAVSIPEDKSMPKKEKWIAQLWCRKNEYKPTVPVGNNHEDAASAIEAYCLDQQ
eukprot:CAMPEP_0178973402 /NCGR_PEP_ID=MMETSP0789-20121207/21705_1 /TAXON_ID=3005 /ORGANISM="Rhizosolenia setigera, Strain CCMP 1694" /LENGTH=403 /DNA_ID=CAMNT_0020661269 /DNA_START=156 /DNA_END=1369 /DNA_ORIENTATION=+